MNDMPPLNPALLPAGLRDLLPPEAQTEAGAVESVLRVFAAHGYGRVDPPLLEFEDTLLAGSGAATSDQIFRLMDPESHRMMGLRADMTPQIARIASTRLVSAPRPLRLSYAGLCVRARPGTDRQVPQAGLELIGPDCAAADAEILTIGAEALASIGLPALTLDLTLPTLAPALLDEAGFAGAPRAALARAVDRKDLHSVRTLGGALAPLLTELLLAAGPAEAALAVLASACLPPRLRALADRLAALVGLLRDGLPALTISIDPLEFRGFQYHTGIAFSLFAQGGTEELARGGRYQCGEAEPATGLTFYADAVLRAAPKPAAAPSVFLPAGTPAAVGADLRGQNFVTIAGLAPVDNDAAEARRLGCTHLLSGDRPEELKPT